MEEAPRHKEESQEMIERNIHQFLEATRRHLFGLMPMQPVTGLATATKPAVH